MLQLNKEQFQISRGQFSVHLLVMTCDALSLRIMRKSFRSIVLLDEGIDGGVTVKKGSCNKKPRESRLMTRKFFEVD